MRRTLRLVKTVIGAVLLFIPIHAQEESTLSQDGDSAVTEVGNREYWSSPEGTFSGVHSTLSADRLSSLPYMDVTAGFDGMVPGLETSSVGVPGGFVRMNIRGVNTLFAGTEPLIVIDGVPFENATFDAAGYRFSGLSEIDPRDIESVTILKDAAASAIFGSRAANGVLLIRTKNGSPGENRVNIHYRFGLTDSPGKLDLLTGPQFTEVLNRAWENSYPAADGPSPVALHTYDGFYSEPYTDTITGETFQPNLSDTDWYGNMWNRGTFHMVNFDVSGGDDRTIYYISGGFRDEAGLLFSGKYQRAGARVKIEHQANRRLRLGLNIYLASKIRDINDRAWFETAHTTALPVYPVWSPNDPDMYWYSQDHPVNIEALNRYSWNRSGGYRTFNKAFLQFEFIEGLMFRSDWSWDFQHFLHEDYQHPFVAPAENGLLIINRSDRSNWSSNQYLAFDRKWNNHTLGTLAGFSLENYSWDANQLYNPGMTLAFVHSNGESNQLRQVGVWLANSRWASLYGKVRYSFRGKYSANFTIRGDASSRFGPDRRWFLAPAGGVEWNMKKESFAAGIDQLSAASLHASYGIVGNAQIGNFTHLSSMTEGYYDDPNVLTDGYYRYGLYPAVVPVNMANRMLGPEAVTQVNAGLKTGWLDDRFGLEANYFMNTVSDLLQYIPISILYGYENTLLWENNGELQVTGLELAVAGELVRSETGLVWDLGLHLTTARTVLNTLPEGIDHVEGYFTRGVPGETLGGYYLAEWAGVDPATGHELIRDAETGEAIDGEVLTDAEFDSHAIYQPGKTPFPTLYGGLRSQLSFRGFDLSVLLTMKRGHYLLDLGEQSLSYIGSASTGISGLTGGWTGQAPTGTPLLYETRMRQRVTDRYLHDASFLRLQQVGLGYTLPSSWSKRVYMEQTRIYVSAANLMTWSQFPGYDPNGLHSNYHSMSPLDAGVLTFEPPQPRTVMFGIQLTF